VTPHLLVLLIPGRLLVKVQYEVAPMAIVPQNVADLEALGLLPWAFYVIEELMRDRL